MAPFRGEGCTQFKILSEALSHIDIQDSTNISPTLGSYRLEILACGHAAIILSRNAIISRPIERCCLGPRSGTSCRYECFIR
ncbi:hypothetical protein F4824DRAFT_456446 [Ustulina deusta]|nr:hypothetical protein F4824DRAFT_456446 [Ustulina deusta]